MKYRLYFFSVVTLKPRYNGPPKPYSNYHGPYITQLNSHEGSIIRLFETTWAPKVCRILAFS